MFCVSLFCSAAHGETVYPVVDPRFTIAATRHEGECLFGSVGFVSRYGGATLGEMQPVPIGTGTDTQSALEFSWGFQSPRKDEFVGPFFALRRPTLDTTKPDGSAGRATRLPSSVSVNLRRFEQTGGVVRSIEVLRLRLALASGTPKCAVVTELKDASNHTGQVFFYLDPADGPTRTVDIPVSFFSRAGVNLSKAAQITLLIKETQARFHNPASGAIRVLGIEFVDNDGSGASAAEIAALPDVDFVANLARREFETLWRLADAKTGFSWDRTLFPDLIHTGSTGWLLAALPYAVERGWVTEKAAMLRALKILRWADKRALFHNKPAGALGNSAGVFYRFLGYRGGSHRETGTRKLDTGAINNVEASIIDTAILQYGVAMFANGTAPTTRSKKEVHRRAQSILARTQWNQLTETGTGRLFLGWKPELDATEDNGYFTTPAPFGGYFSSKDAVGTPLTIDFHTVEGQFAALFAIGSTAHPTSPSAWYAMTRTQKTAGGQTVIASYPGAIFTSLYGVGLLPSTLGADRGVEWGAGSSVDWFQNMAKTFRAYAALSPVGTLVLPDAVEFPNTEYAAQGLPALAVDGAANFKGTISPFSLEMALGLRGADAATAITELRRLITAQPALWHPLWGLADAYHPNLATFPDSGLSRAEGTWIQGQKFTLNAGAGLMGALNYLTDGAVAQRAATHPIIADALNTIYQTSPP